MDQSFENRDDSEDRLVGDSIGISDSDKDVVENSVTAASAVVVESCDKDTDVSRISTPKQKLGEKAQATRDREFTLMDELLQDLDKSLNARPTENEKEKDPRGLKVQLMPHQQHALTWLLWREKQRLAGGVLADDMGLGKKLTMISLIMTIQKDSIDERDDDESSNDHKPLCTHHKGGTLVVCFELSSLFQWDNEVRNRCERGLLTVEKYYGKNRESVPELLSKNDIVITTYNTLRREHETRSTLYKINWERVILNEAHVIRNPETQRSLAVCELKANKRWALTGTPIQNKAMDLYPILRFLTCLQFDNLRVWEQWVDNKNAADNQILATVMKSLMLRRTKQELIEKGELESLPKKPDIEKVIVELNEKERLVYNELMRADVKPHNFKFLLRLHQLCCHPPLIHAKLDQDFDLLSQMSNISLNEIDKKEKKEVDIDSRIAENLLTAENPIFRDGYISSKMETLLNMVKEILQKDEDKLIIVSQWTALLDVIAKRLSSIKGATFSKFTGNVTKKDRENIIDSFNSQNSGPRILLLSLKAGGVGLNLEGANHLLLFDIHYNPQLEKQVLDRIYCFGQKKKVHVYKLICDNTIEEEKLNVQDEKLETASNVLTHTEANI